MKRKFRTVPFAWLVAAAFMVGSPLAASATPLSPGTATAKPQAKKPKGKVVKIDAKATKREEILKWLKIYLRDAGEEFDSYDSMDKILWTKSSGKKNGYYIASLKIFDYWLTFVGEIRRADENDNFIVAFPAIVFSKGAWKSINDGTEKNGFGISFVFKNSQAGSFTILTEAGRKLIFKRDGEKGFWQNDEREKAEQESILNFIRNDWLNTPNNPGKRFLAALKDLVDLECSGPAEKSPYE